MASLTVKFPDGFRSALDDQDEKFPPGFRSAFDQSADPNEIIVTQPTVDTEILKRQQAQQRRRLPSIEEIGQQEFAEGEEIVSEEGRVFEQPTAGQRRIQEFAEGEEIVSEEGRVFEQPTADQRRIKELQDKSSAFDYNNIKQARVLLSDQSTTQDLQNANPFVLLEAVNQARVFGDRRKRQSILRILKSPRHGFTNEIIKAYIDIDRPSGFVAELKREVPKSILPGIASLATQRITGSPIRAAGAAAATATGQEFIIEGANRLLHPERTRSEKQVAIDTAKIAAIEGGSELLAGTVLEPLGRLAGSRIREARRLSRIISESGKDVVADLGTQPLPRRMGEMAIQTAFGNFNAGLTPAQQTGGRLLQISEDIIRNTSIGGQSVKPFDAFQGATTRSFKGSALHRVGLNAIDEATTDLTKQLDASSLGVVLANGLDYGKTSSTLSGLTHARKAWKGMVSVAYESIDDEVERQLMAQGISDFSVVSTVSTKDAIQRTIDQIDAGTKVEVLEEALDRLKKFLPMRNNLTYKQGIAMRSALGDIERAIPGRETSAHRLINEVFQAMDDSMADTAKDVGGNTFNLWRGANDLRAKGEPVFHSKLMYSIFADADAGEFAKITGAMFNPTDPDRLRNMRNILVPDNIVDRKARGAAKALAAGKTPNQVMADRRLWDTYRRTWLGEQLKGGPGAVKAALEAGDSSGFSKILLSPAERQNFDDFLALADVIVRPEASQGEKTIARILGLTADAALLGGGGFSADLLGLGKVGSTIGSLVAGVGGESALARVITNGTFKNWVFPALQVGAEAATGRPARAQVGRVIADIAQAVADIESEQQGLRKFQGVLRDQARVQRAHQAHEAEQRRRRELRDRRLGR